MYNQGFIDCIELALDFGLEVSQEDIIVYNKMIEEGNKEDEENIDKEN